MNNAVPLYDWSTTMRPGHGQICLQGRIEANMHPVKRKAGRVITSDIAEIKGRIVTTASGTIYKLENPDPKYLEWMKEAGYEYHEDEPIGWGEGSRKVRE